MRILIIQKRFHPNTYGYVKALAERGHELGMVVHSGGAPGALGDLVQPVQVPYGRLSRRLARLFGSKAVHRFAPPQITAYARAFRSFRPDVVLVKKLRVGALAGILFARLHAVPWILWRNNPPRRTGAWARALGRAFGRAATITTTVGAGDEPAGGWINGARFLPYPIELPGGREPGPPPDGRPVRLLVVVKYGSARKRPEWVVEALARAQLTRPVTISFVGSGGPNSRGAVAVREAAAAHGLSDRVTLRYSLPHEEMNAVYASHDVLVLPSRGEPFGMVVLEAMANGLPVVCSDTVWSKCCLVDGESGLIFPTEELDGLRLRLEALCNHPERIGAMGAAARRRVENHYTLGAWADAFEELVPTAAAGSLRGAAGGKAGVG